MAEPRDHIPMQDDFKIQILHEPTETPSLSRLTSNAPSEVEKWSARFDTCSMVSFPLSVSILAGPDAAFYTMTVFLVPVVMFQLYCWWRHWSAGRQQNSK
ncbi:hypothetical protein N7471_006627 [Penicillium samsonianum]|uniref:uncharacterized protein n=1 Tax=Penicillium samsonianum TaxID=1882272 RepID=UPI002546C9A5|nr:uncharacterized protein N7471_006627 [Penicillium samsonianum]KAJ6140141.1 hypothetical protein N7471_006627 [Penicillium samsonianum]